MSYLPSLPDDAKLVDVFRRYPVVSNLLLEFHEVLLRGPSPFTVAQRELIAAYVSANNACDYCHGIHEATAEALGAPAGLLRQLLEDVDAADVEPFMKPVLHYVQKLTREPSRITPQDAEAVLAAGWNEQALHDAVSICALFNYMNRLVEGLGIEAGPDHFKVSSERLADIGYAGLARTLTPE